MSPSLTRGAARRGALPIVDDATVDDFIAQTADVALLFFRGDAERFPEADDLAVIVPELVAGFPGRLRAAEVARAAEPSLMARFGVEVCPSLVFARPGRTLAAIAKVHDWSHYIAQIGAVLAAEEALCVLESPR